MAVLCPFSFKMITVAPGHSFSESTSCTVCADKPNMNPRNPKILLAAAILLTAAFGALVYVWLSAGSKPQAAAGFDSSKPPWSWENPDTREKTTIPPQWQKAGSHAVRGAVLTLQHWTGKCLIYLVHERSANDTSLEEFVNDTKSDINKELGIENIGPAGGGKDYDTGDGAKLMGSAVATTHVRIWRSGPYNFWRASVVADQDYKHLAFEAEKVIDSLMKTTR